MKELTNKYPWIIKTTSRDKDGEEKTTFKVIPMELAKYIRENSHYIFVRGQATEAQLMYAYVDGVYRLITEDELKGLIKEFIPYQFRKSRDINEVFFDIKTDNNFVDYEALNADESIINFKDGLFSLNDMKLHPHDPSVYSTIQIPCNFSDIKEAPDEAPNFESYINTLSNNDEQTKNLLLQCLGLVISNIRGYRTKKALFLVGKGNSGKSQLKRLAEYLVGTNNISNIDLKTLSDKFGTSSLYQKRLAGCNDMSYQRVEDMSLFKQLTGGDTISIEFKHNGFFSFVFKGFLWFNCNKLPRFGGDTGKWVYERILPVYCNNVIPKAKQDPYLFDKMLSEKESIIKMALNQLVILMANNYQFIEPQGLTEQRHTYEIENNTLLTFIKECCEYKDNIMDSKKVRRSVFNKAYSKWCQENFSPRSKLSIADIKSTLESEYGENVFCRNNDGCWCLNNITFTRDGIEEIGIFVDSKGKYCI